MDVGGAPLDRLSDDLVDELDDRRVIGRLVQVDDLRHALLGLVGLPVGVGDDVLEAIKARDQGGDVLGRGDRDAYLVAGHDRDVVDRQDVRGIGHRHQQRALVGERDGHRLVALGGGRGDEVGGGHVDREHAEIEMIQAIALGERAREAVVGERAAFEQDALGSRAKAARALDRLVDLPARGQPHIDDHVGQEARGGAAAAGPGDAGPLALARSRSRTGLLVHSGRERRLRLLGLVDRHVPVESDLAVESNLSVQCDLRVDGNLPVERDLRVERDVLAERDTVVRRHAVVGRDGPLDFDDRIAGRVRRIADAEDRVQVGAGLLRRFAHRGRAFAVRGEATRKALEGSPPAMEVRRSGPAGWSAWLIATAFQDARPRPTTCPGVDLRR